MPEFPPTLTRPGHMLASNGAPSAMIYAATSSFLPDSDIVDLVIDKRETSRPSFGISAMRSTRNARPRDIARQALRCLACAAALNAVPAAALEVDRCGTDTQGPGGTNLATALAAGGTITFRCGGGPATIRMTTQHLLPDRWTSTVAV